MKNLFSFGVLLVFGLVAVGAYWYLNPEQAPTFLRGALPNVELRGPTVGFR
ncbi:MAG: hypothetical protein L0Y71_09585 [Gemmataceae bacterium]|nr:hypothetical protein [Gemmataceae bacterium]